MNSNQLARLIEREINERDFTVLHRSSEADGEHGMTKETVTRRQYLEKLLVETRQELNEIKSKEDHAKSSVLVGRFFKTRNNYSCPTSADDYWWLYLRVTGANGMGVHVDKFQQDKNGEIFIRPDSFMMYTSLDSYTQITKAEFDRERKKMLATVAKVLK